MRSRTKLRRSTEFLLSNEFIKALMILGVSLALQMSRSSLMFGIMIILAALKDLPAL